MRRLLPLLAAVGLAASASATPQFWETFQKTYGVKAGSAFDRAQCQTCHTVNIPAHNPYGEKVKSSLKASGVQALTAAILRAVEKDDSDGDGWTNGDEIAKGFLPGEKTSHPSEAPPKHGKASSGKGAKEGGTGGTMAGDADEAAQHQSMMDRMVPKHSFHPVLVHFPVALFIFGAFLELVGFRLRKPALREAAYWNLLAGSATTTVSIATGFVVALRLGYSLLPGTAVFTHLAIAILASLAMLATVLWRRKGAHVGWGYFALLVLAAALVGLAGHFGGGMVYG